MMKEAMACTPPSHRRCRKGRYPLSETKELPTTGDLLTHVASPLSQEIEPREATQSTAGTNQDSVDFQGQTGETVMATILESFPGPRSSDFILSSHLTGSDPGIIPVVQVSYWRFRNYLALQQPASVLTWASFPK